MNEIIVIFAVFVYPFRVYNLKRRLYFWGDNHK